MKSAKNNKRIKIILYLRINIVQIIHRFPNNSQAFKKTIKWIIQFHTFLTNFSLLIGDFRAYSRWIFHRPTLSLCLVPLPSDKNWENCSASILENIHDAGKERRNYNWNLWMQFEIANVNAELQNLVRCFRDDDLQIELFVLCLAIFKII